jgi:glutaminyl-tRNA synthetase
MSKRKLLELGSGKTKVNGWDDPRMPTICGLRRRGYTPESIRNFADTIGVAKRDNVIDVSLLEFCIREDLNKRSNRIMAVLNPVKLSLITSLMDRVEEMEAVNNPEDESKGKVMFLFQENFSSNVKILWKTLLKSFSGFFPGGSAFAVCLYH